MAERSAARGIMAERSAARDIMAGRSAGRGIMAEKSGGRGRLGDAFIHGLLVLSLRAILFGGWDESKTKENQVAETYFFLLGVGVYTAIPQNSGICYVKYSLTV